MIMELEKQITKEIHERVMKIDAIGHILRMNKPQLHPIQINRYGKRIQQLCAQIREYEDGRYDNKGILIDTRFR